MVVYCVDCGLIYDDSSFSDCPMCAVGERVFTDSEDKPPEKPIEEDLDEED